LAAAAALAMGAAQAQEKKPTPQQQRMAQCNKQAEGMTGDARQKFMSECLAGKGGTPARAARRRARPRSSNA
jgi:hypothetical protein